MISGLLRPDSGSITPIAKTHTTDSIGIKPMIDYLPVGAPRYGEMTVLSFYNLSSMLVVYRVKILILDVPIDCLDPNQKQ